MDKNDANDFWVSLYGDIKVQEVGHLVTTNIHPDRVMPYWVIGFLKSGQRTIRVGEHSLYLYAKDYFILPPFVRHQGISEDKHDVFFMHFKANVGNIEPITEIQSDKILLPLSGRLPDVIDFITYVEFLTEQYNNHLISDDFLNRSLKNILSLLSFCFQKSYVWKDKSNSLAQDIMRFISENYQNELNAGSFESKFKLTYRQLNNVFKKTYLVPIKQKVINIRIQNARDLLIAGESIQTAASNSGFYDYFYFLKAFKKEKGMTPKQLQEKYGINSHKMKYQK